MLVSEMILHQIVHTAEEIHTEIDRSLEKVVEIEAVEDSETETEAAVVVDLETEVMEEMEKGDLVVTVIGATEGMAKDHLVVDLVDVMATEIEDSAEMEIEEVSAETVETEGSAETAIEVSAETVIETGASEGSFLI